MYLRQWGPQFFCSTKRRGGSASGSCVLGFLLMTFLCRYRIKVPDRVSAWLWFRAPWRASVALWLTADMAPGMVGLDTAGVQHVLPWPVARPSPRVCTGAVVVRGVAPWCARADDDAECKMPGSVALRRASCRSSTRHPLWHGDRWPRDVSVCIDTGSTLVMWPVRPLAAFPDNSTCAVTVVWVVRSADGSSESARGRN